jgi:hypothetical protein
VVGAGILSRTSHPEQSTITNSEVPGGRGSQIGTTLESLPTEQPIITSHEVSGSGGNPPETPPWTLPSEQQNITTHADQLNISHKLKWIASALVLVLIVVLVVYLIPKIDISRKGKESSTLPHLPTSTLGLGQRKTVSDPAGGSKADRDRALIQEQEHLAEENKKQELMAEENKKLLEYSQSLSKPPPPTPTPIIGQREAVRVLVLDTLHQGTLLSASISKLPKLDKVLQSAKDLQKIDPIRYQSYVTTAESTLGTASNQRDKNLMAYLNKVLELVRYTPDQVSYALSLIMNEDISSREKLVAELLAEHMKSLHNSPNADSALFLSNFTQRFNNFVD